MNCLNFSDVNFQKIKWACLYGPKFLLDTKTDLSSVMRILNKAKVFITPGGIFGTAGEAYVRVSLCSKREVLQEAIDRIKNAGLANK